MVINYIMSLSRHSMGRLSERYPNIKDFNLLNSSVTRVNSYDEALYLNTCKPESKRILLAGYRELVYFDDYGILGVVNKSNLQLVTVLPNKSKHTKAVSLSNLELIDRLRDKIIKSQDMHFSKRKDPQIGYEMNRVCREIKKLKKAESEFKKEKHESTVDKEIKTFNAFKKLVKLNLGTDKFIELITQARVSVEQNLKEKV